MSQDCEGSGGGPSGLGLVQYFSLFTGHTAVASVTPSEFPFLPPRSANRVSDVAEQEAALGARHGTGGVLLDLAIGPAHAVGTPPPGDFNAFLRRLRTRQGVTLMAVWGRIWSETGELPAREDLDPALLKPVLPYVNLFVRDWREGSDRSTLSGTAIGESLEVDLTGRLDRDVFPQDIADLFVALDPLLHGDSRPVSVCFHLGPLGRPHKRIEMVSAPIQWRKHPDRQGGISAVGDLAGTAAL